MKTKTTTTKRTKNDKTEIIMLIDGKEAELAPLVQEEEKKEVVVPDVKEEVKEPDIPIVQEEKPEVVEDVPLDEEVSAEGAQSSGLVIEFASPLYDAPEIDGVTVPPIEVKGMTRKERRLARLKRKLLNPVDIKYSGIFTYRYLRIFAWLAIAISQIVVLHGYSENAYPWLFWAPANETVLKEFADMSMPLFLVATFAYILSRNRSYFNMLVFYLLSYIGIACAEVFIFRRYAISVMSAMGVEAKVTAQILGLLTGQKVQVNIFSDLCVLTAFTFFINYNPHKYFQGKKIYWFRAMCIIPILLSIGSYVVRWLGVSDTVQLPIDVYPFLTTKSPFVHLIFIIISLWIKYRERLFTKMGATHKQYEAFLRTNRNSLSFSVQVSVLFLIFSVIDFLTGVIFLIAGYFEGYEESVVLAYAHSIGIGQCVGLFLTIPIVMLFSYTKDHKNPMIDMIVPIVGVGLFVFVYVEGIYEIVINSIESLTASLPQ